MTTKNNGVYYTPKALSEYMVQHSFKDLPKGQELSILEPSCGDGVFIEAISNNLDKAEKKLCSLECVEIDSKALAAAKTKSCNNFKQARFINRDYLDFLVNKRKRYDLIIGNPPYVVRKRLSEETIEKCKAVYQDTGLTDKYFRNIWGAFLVGSMKLLSDTGVLAFVLPAELLQVKFSEELRNSLIEDFERVEIVSFKNIVFEGIEQDTIILFCHKQHSKKGLFFDEKTDIADLVKNSTSFQGKDLKSVENMKWTCYILTEEELNLISACRKMFSPISDYCTAVAGIVTAANNYFIVDDETVKEYELEKFVLPVIQRGLYISGRAVFTSDSLELLRKSGKACNLLNFNGYDEVALSKKARDYIELGKEQKIDQRYKCQRRSPWYSIPGIWKSEGFFFKRSHLYPKILENKAESMVTDSAYRIKMLDDKCIQSLVYSFYNSLTLSLVELEGRFYGGGVLELTPNEFKSIHVPYTPINKKEFSDFSERFEKKASIDEILVRSDKEILTKIYGISSSDVQILQNIKKKLTARRLKQQEG